MALQLGIGGDVPVLWTFGIATAIPMVLVVYTISRRRQGRTTAVFTGTMLALAIWSGAYLARYSSPTLEAKIAWQFVATTGFVLVPPGYLLFTALYTDRIRRVKGWYLGLLVVHPLLALAAFATNPRHELYYRGFEVVSVGGRPALSVTPGPLFWLGVGYAGVLMVLSTVLLVEYALRYRSKYRLAAALVVVGATVPWLGMLATPRWVVPTQAVDPTPLAIAVGSLSIATGVFGAKLIDIAPIARNTVFDALDDAVVVVDPLDHIVDFNEAAAELFDAQGSPLAVGARASELLPDSVVNAGTGETVQLGNQERWYRCRRLPIDESNRGTAVILTDVTAFYRQQEHLQRQNQRMTEFSGAAAHHLRNPLGVITGYVDLAEESGEERYFEGIRTATARMTRLVNDLVTLSKEGRLVEEQQAANLREAATVAWERVETQQATLQVEPGLGTVSADTERLVRLFEHAFKSALDRGGPDVVIQIRRVHYGFAIVDDGVVPATDDEGVLFSAEQRTTDRSMFGLPVVKSIAEAHGWQTTFVGDDGEEFSVQVTGVTRIATDEEVDSDNVRQTSRVSL